MDYEVKGCKKDINYDVKDYKEDKEYDIKGYKKDLLLSVSSLEMENVVFDAIVGLNLKIFSNA